jgi:hypothetical protein
MRVAPIDLSFDLIQRSVMNVAVRWREALAYVQRTKREEGETECGSAADDDTYPRELCTSNDMKRVGGSMVRIY